jgi:flagella basal body P-ring formation protein FlgA
MRLFRALVVLGALPFARVSAQAATTCATAAHALTRGATLTAADLAVAPNASCQRDALPPDSLVGRVTRRVIRAGEPLREPGVALPPAVSAGEFVEVVLQERGVRLSMQGTATASAAVGQIVWVRLGAKQRVQGTVTGRGTVTVSDSTRSS